MRATTVQAAEKRCVQNDRAPAVIQGAATTNRSSPFVQPGVVHATC